MSSPAIQEVRALFNTRVKEGIPNPPGEFHPVDIETRVNNDSYIKRILLHQEDNVKASADMLWDICVWRKTVNANELSESNINMEYIKEGGTFARGRDIEKSLLLIFKCKKHVKGQKDFEELKKCIIYWFNRVEREENGHPVSLFFDMENCGLSNMDMEFIKYLISLMKFYYPFFLQYIIIYEMPWILSAAFKVVSSLLPAKAVAKMKFLSKKTLGEIVKPDQALTAWGGQDDYTFEFIPESKSKLDHTPKKVTFEEDTQHSPGEMLKIVPNAMINFEILNDEVTGLFTITNMDEGAISFKIRTTSPEKFRVRPSTSTLASGASQVINLTVQPGYQLRTGLKDRFLVMSIQIPKLNMSPQELSDIWQNSTGSKIDEYRLKCTFPDKEPTKNGSIVDAQNEKPNSVLSTLNMLQTESSKLSKEMKVLKLYQLFTLLLTTIAVILGYLLYKNSCVREDYCERI